MNIIFIMIKNSAAARCERERVEEWRV